MTMKPNRKSHVSIGKSPVTLYFTSHQVYLEPNYEQIPLYPSAICQDETDVDKQSFHLIFKKAFRLIDDEVENVRHFAINADAMDVNEGQLRILGETAKSHQVAGLITTLHSTLRVIVRYSMIKCCLVPRVLDSMSKRANLLWNRKLEDMEELKNLQDELLDSASKLVKPGGFLIYSTCSIDPDENQGRVGSVSPKTSLKHSLDGAFAALLVRAL